HKCFGRSGANISQITDVGNFFRLLCLGGRNSKQKDSNKKANTNPSNHCFTPPIFAAHCFLLSAYSHLMTLSARASTFGGITNHFRFSILDTSTSLSTVFRLFDHRITLSALAKTFGGIVSSICFAV